MKKFAGDIIILYMCTKNHNHMIHGSWDKEWHRQNFLSFWAIFCPSIPLTTRKIKILKLKKMPGDIIILHICTINDNHMMYGSWDKECNKQIFLSFWTIFCLSSPYGPRKSKFWRNEQHTRRYYHFTNAYHKWQLYDVWLLRYEMQQTEFLVILNHFMPVYPPNNPKNQNFEKLKKMPGDIIILHMCIINEIQMMYGSWDTKCYRHIFCNFGPFFAL